MTEAETPEDWQGVRAELMRLLEQSPTWRGKVRPFIDAAGLAPKTFYAIERNEPGTKPDERTVRLWLNAVDAPITLDDFYRQFHIKTPGRSQSLSYASAAQLDGNGTPAVQSQPFPPEGHNNVGRAVRLSRSSLIAIADQLGVVARALTTLAVQVRTAADEEAGGTGSARSSSGR